MRSSMRQKTLQRCCRKRGPDHSLTHGGLFRVKRMEIGGRFPRLQSTFSVPSAFVSKTESPDGLSVLRTIGSEIIKACGLWRPTHHQSPTKGRTLDAPFHGKLSALWCGQLRGEGVHIAIVARREALPVFTIRIDDPGMQMGCASDHTAAPL